MKRGRKKGSKNKHKGMPENYTFWRSILQDDQIEEFIVRGDERQHELIKHTLLYLEKDDLEIFEQIKSKQILRRLK